ncbi:hypothetical protein K2X85_19360 [bacterium]|nr:hypothetical protein [bacterium]
MLFPRGQKILAGLIILSTAMSVNHAGESSTAPSRESLEADFVRSMTGTVLVGSFTLTGQESDGKPRPDKYTITKVEKKEGNNWLVVARVEYERGAFPVAIKVPVEWAGTTPVICVTDLEIPLIGKGKFGARVLFDGDKYAGTWSHDAVGGHMFGKLERVSNSSAGEKK